MLHRILAAGFVATLALPVSATTITDRYTSFYVFGDSLSDDGKFGQLAADPPSEGGRFSNGKVWAEHIAADFVTAGRDAGNLAVGGATATDIGTFTPLSNFNGQIDAFLGSIAFNAPLITKFFPAPQFADAAPTPGANPLAAVWFGGNDLFAAFGDDPIITGFNPADVVDAAKAVTDGIRRLATSPLGDFDDFLVANLPDLGATPAYNFLLTLIGATDEQIATASGVASEASALFNIELTNNLDQLEDDLNVNLIRYDAAQAFADTIADGIFASTTLPCTVSLNSDSNPFICTEAEADALLFVDGVHPNQVAQFLTAQNVRAQLAAVPLPAGAPLIMFAVAGLGWVGRRRRAA